MAGQPDAIEIQLVPPPDVSFFSSETKEIFKNKSLTWWQSTPAGTISWSVDIYKYCTGAVPTDPNFADRGAIVCIFVHRGNVNIGDIHYERRFSVNPSSSKMIGTIQEPPTHSGVQSGNTWNYTIDYRETFQMFKNQGNEATAFQAIYHEDFSREKSQQTGFINDNGGASFYIQYKDNPGKNATFSIKGLSIFKCKDPNAFPMTFDFQHDGYFDDGHGDLLCSSQHQRVGFPRILRCVVIPRRVCA